jgi:hypothetical protein
MGVQQEARGVGQVALAPFACEISWGRRGAAEGLGVHAGPF